MNNPTTIQFLFIITLWDNDSPLAYAVIATDYKEASRVAIDICKGDRLEEHKGLPDPKVDDDLSWNLNCAPDIKGNLYDLKIIKQVRNS